MSEQILRNRYGEKIGSIEMMSGGVQIGRNKYGEKVGEYDSTKNVTRDRHGEKIGEGNLLASLITSA